MPKLKKKATAKPVEDWSQRPEGPLVLEVGLPGDGAVYELSPRFDVWLEETCPDRRRASTVFVGFPNDRMEDFEKFQRPYWEYVALMLTGFSLEELREWKEVR